MPVVLLGSLNFAGQAQMSAKLAETRGRGFLSDAIHRFAADLNAMPEKPFLWFPDAVLALPVIVLTRASVPITDQMDDPEPRRTLCAGRDVAMVRIRDHPSEARAREWHANLGWDAPTARPYAQADGTVIFDVLTYDGRRDGPGCRRRDDDEFARDAVTPPAAAIPRSPRRSGGARVRASASKRDHASATGPPTKAASQASSASA